MLPTVSELLRIRRRPPLHKATMVLALSGWMDGGDVSTGTVNRLILLLEAQPFADIDPEPFYLFNFPGSMEMAALFRPHVEIKGGLVQTCDMPSNLFSVSESANLVLFVGKEPNLLWRTYADCLFRLAHEVDVRRIVFVGSFGGSVPHTREPRLYITCSEAALLAEMEQYGLRRSGYRGPGSLTTYLMSRAPAEGLEMVSLVAEIPSYLQGTNPRCIEAVSRRLAKMLKLPLDLASLRQASTEWELGISTIIEENKELAKTVRQLEEAYDNELLEQEE